VRSRLNLSRKLSFPARFRLWAPAAPSGAAAVLVGFVFASALLRGTVLWDTVVLLASVPGQLAAEPF
jgi:hypothetical protein